MNGNGDVSVKIVKIIPIAAFEYWKKTLQINYSAGSKMTIIVKNFMI